MGSAIDRRAFGLGLIGAAGLAATSAKAATVLKIGHVLAANHPFQKGLEKAGAELEKRTEGRVQLQIFPSSQLGSERDMHVAVRGGSVDMVLASPGGASVHLKELAVIDAPYLFRDDAHWRAVVYGPIGKAWEEKIVEASGVHIVGWFHRGTRHVISKSKPFNTLAEMKGQKIRVADFPPFPQVFKALGAVPTPIAFAEMYSALQSGIVDGADTPLDTILSMKLYETAKYANLISWSYAAPGVIVMSDQAYKSLSPADRDALVASLRIGTDLIAETFISGDEDVKKQLVANGMQLVVPTDLDAWRKAAAEQAIPDLARAWGGDVQLYTKIRDYKA
ncbi:TRAP transporter substrate-binding protein [uncultured Alsobacter sp.]|uniref:TRAP transporter substrate-binding protein n=1 Tax=uncultured Alsobacter sp. TaxID=1748258 RepID=UPI0025FDB12F|nr:TRAP transporter substrate-binding protein [uncultured Alsobacter sp.]